MNTGPLAYQMTDPVHCIINILQRIGHRTELNHNLFPRGFVSHAGNFVNLLENALHCGRKQRFWRFRGCRKSGEVALEQVVYKIWASKKPPRIGGGTGHYSAVHIGDNLDVARGMKVCIVELSLTWEPKMDNVHLHGWQAPV